MSSFDLVSGLIGSGLTLLTGAALYFVTNILLFQSRVFWSSGDYEQELFRLEDPNTHKNLVVCLLSTLIKVKGWKPVRDVKIYVDGQFSHVKISPEVPYQVFRNEEASAYLLVGVLNPGSYKLDIQNRGGDKYDRIKISGVESSNGTSVKRNLKKASFELPFYIQAALTLVIGSIASGLLVAYLDMAIPTSSSGKSAGVSGQVGVSEKK
jgi:hypothetical protein